MLIQAQPRFEVGQWFAEHRIVFGPSPKRNEAAWRSEGIAEGGPFPVIRPTRRRLSWQRLRVPVVE
jgi:hypothetical protein